MFVALATVVEFLDYLRYICVNIHSPWQQYYILQNPLKFSAFGIGWVESDRREVNWKLWGGANDLYCGIGHCNGIFGVLTVCLRKYTHSWQQRYSDGSNTIYCGILAALDLWDWLGGIQVNWSQSATDV